MSAPVTTRGSVRFADLLLSEWTKVRSLRSSAYTLLAMMVMGIGVSALIGGGIGADFEAMSPEDRQTFDPTATVFNSLFVGQLVMSVLGILVITSEHTTGMIKTSLAATPRRGRLLAAKTLVFTAIALVSGQVMAFGTFLVGQAMIATNDGVPYASLGDAGVPSAIFGAGLYLAAIGLLAVAVGTLVRVTAGALAFMAGITLIVPAISPVFPSWMDGLLTIWPSIGGISVTQVIADPDYPSPWQNFGGMCLGIAGVLVAAFVVFRRRDV